jgi:hypothetical protein
MSPAILSGQLTPRQVAFHEREWGLDRLRVKVGNRVLYRGRQVQAILRAKGALS